MQPAGVAAIQVRHRGLLTFAITLGPLMQVLDSSIMSVALRHMQGTLSAAQDQIAWVLTSYLVAVAIMTPLSGVLSSKFGRKRVFLVSIAGFIIASMLSGMSDSLTEILIYRFIQGFFGAALVPVSQSMMLDIYPREDFGVAMAWWGVGIMFGPVFGPTLGGYITEYYSWRWVFYLNLPVGVLAFMMISILAPETRDSDRPFGYLGFLALALGMVCLQLMLDRGERLDWFTSTEIVILAALAGLGFYWFAINTATSRRPFIDAAVLRDKNFVLGLLIKALFGAVLIGMLALIPPFLQNLAGYPVITTGLVMAPRGIATMAAALIAGRLVKRIDPRHLIAFGMVVTALTTWQMSTFTPDVGPAEVFTVNFIQGIGFGFFFVPLSTVTFSTLAQSHRNVGTSFYALSSNVGKGIGVSILVAYLVRNSQANHSALVEYATPFNQALGHVPLPETWSFIHPQGLAAFNAVIAKQASLIAYVNDFRALALVILISAPLVYLMNNPLPRFAALAQTRGQEVP
jgi:DHA2 family multidrug resistance protein